MDDEDVDQDEQLSSPQALPRTLVEAQTLVRKLTLNDLRVCCVNYDLSEEGTREQLRERLLGFYYKEIKSNMADSSTPRRLPDRPTSKRLSYAGESDFNSNDYGVDSKLRTMHSSMQRQVRTALNDLEERVERNMTSSEAKMNTLLSDLKQELFDKLEGLVKTLDANQVHKDESSRVNVEKEDMSNDELTRYVKKKTFISKEVKRIEIKLTTLMETRSSKAQVKYYLNQAQELIVECRHIVEEIVTKCDNDDQVNRELSS